MPLHAPIEQDGHRQHAEALERAGAIEGRVLVPPGREPAGRIVGASSGWGIAWTAVADAEGRYRIEGLAQEPYQVRPCLPPAAARQEYHARLPDPDVAESVELAWDCVVRPGETARVDLDLRDEEDFVLAGRFAFDAVPQRWTARLLPRDPPSSFPIAAAPLAADGRFELRLSRGGPLVLELVSGRRAFRRALDLAPGRTEWSTDVPPATLAVRSAPPSTPDGRAQYAAYRWRGTDGLTYSGYVWASDDASGAQVPAGRGEIVVAPPGGEPTSVREVELAPGEKTVIDLAQPR